MWVWAFFCSNGEGATPVDLAVVGNLSSDRIGHGPSNISILYALATNVDMPKNTPDLEATLPHDGLLTRRI